jgi:hypothetical protein
LNATQDAVKPATPRSKEHHRFVVVRRYLLIVLFILEGKMRLYMQHGAKLVENQLGFLYRHPGVNSDGAACFLICTSLISQHSPSGSLCWQRDTGIAQSSQASVEPLKKPSWENKVERAPAFHACCLGVSEASTPKRLQNLAKAIGPNGETVCGLFLSLNILKLNLACIQHGPLIVKFHIEMFRPFVEFRVARKSNGGLVVSHDVGDRGPIQLCFGQGCAEPL